MSRVNTGGRPIEPNKSIGSPRVMPPGLQAEFAIKIDHDQPDAIGAERNVAVQRPVPNFPRVGAGILETMRGSWFLAIPPAWEYGNTPAHIFLRGFVGILRWISADFLNFAVDKRFGRTYILLVHVTSPMSGLVSPM
jgi:hypothetical protein